MKHTRKYRLVPKETFTSCPSSGREETDIFMSEVASSSSKEVKSIIRLSRVKLLMLLALKTSSSLYCVIIVLQNSFSSFWYSVTSNRSVSNPSEVSWSYSFCILISSFHSESPENKSNFYFWRLGPEISRKYTKSRKLTQKSLLKNRIPILLFWLQSTGNNTNYRCTLLLRTFSFLLVHIQEINVQENVPS